MQSKKTQPTENSNLSKEKVRVKYALPISFKLITLLSFIMLIYLGFENYQILKQINSIDQLNKKLINNIEQNTKKQFANVFSQLGMQLNTVASRKMDNILTNVSDNLTASTKATIDLANSQLLRNKENADEAISIANKLIQTNHIETARIYITNAINHDPTNIKYIDELMSIYRSYYRNDIDLLNEIKSILELSLFQLDSNYIDTAIKYLSEINSDEQKIISSSSKVSSNNIDWNLEFNKIVEVDYNGISTDPKKIDDRYRKLNTILTNIQNNEIQYDNLITSVVAEMEKLKNLYQLATIATKVKNYIILLEAESDYASQSASARLLAASSSMSLFWEHDIKQLPHKLKKLIQNKLPTRLKSIEQKIKKAKSKPYFEKANKVLTVALKDESGRYQDIIERQQKAIESAIDLIHKILFEDYQQKIRQRIKALQDKITIERRAQYVAYQKWASDIISNVFDKINNELNFTDDDAIYIFNHSYLHLIDLRLVSPEVSQAYNKVFQQIIGELPSEKALPIFRTVMIRQKKTLEEF